ncbi:hypothetical protein AcW1_002442 [Taiwanofungus camphoratus]|nr:hypothetical protein AcW1_002442 [Antrodia cinnamomea]
MLSRELGSDSKASRTCPTAIEGHDGLDDGAFCIAPMVSIFFTYAPSIFFEPLTPGVNPSADFRTESRIVNAKVR